MERPTLLAEAIASIHRQTRPPDDVVIGIDPRRLGEVENMNRLMQATNCDWVAFLHDDDLWYSDHLDRVERCIEANACEFPLVDIWVARFRSVGRPQETFPAYPNDFNHLRVDNWFPPSVVIANRERFGLWCPPTQHYGWVDWANWNRLLDEGARFGYTGAVTVDYRFGDWGNGSWDG